MTFTELVNFLKQSRKYDLGSFLFEHVTPAGNQNKIIDCADRWRMQGFPKFHNETCADFPQRSVKGYKKVWTSCFVARSHCASHCSSRRQWGGVNLYGNFALLGMLLDVGPAGDLRQVASILQWSSWILPVAPTPSSYWSKMQPGEVLSSPFFWFENLFSDCVNVSFSFMSDDISCRISWGFSVCK